jgi:peptidoglycan/LPS O-acetylase OafA/YrhL
MSLISKRTVAPVGYYQSLEAFRGIAALSVVVHHLGIVNVYQSAYFKGAGIVVDFFFLLSGFVMAHAYNGRIAKGLGFWQYMRARLARLYPLHLFLLLVWVPYILFKIWLYEKMNLGMNPAHDNNLMSFVANLFLVHSMGFFDHLSWNYPSWSISVEFWTYIVFFFAVRYAYMALSQVMLILSVSCALILTFLAQSAPETHGLLFTYDYGFVRCLMSFGFGVSLNALHKRMSITAPPWLQSVIELLLFNACFFAVAFSIQGVAWQFAAIGIFSITIFWFADSQGVVSVFLKTAPLRFLGIISYSVYMTHAIIVAMVENVFRYIIKIPLVAPEFVGDGRPPLDTPWAGAIAFAVVALVVAVSSLTYRYIEVPGKAFGKTSRKG